MTARSIPASMLSVYNGRDCVGFVLARGCAGFEAFDRDERGLGVFKTAPDAANAVFNATKGDGNAK
jgi:hypothetical protein